VPGDLPTEETPPPVSAPSAPVFAAACAKPIAKRKSVVQPEVTPDILLQRQRAADDYEAALKLQASA